MCGAPARSRRVRHTRVLAGSVRWHARFASTVVGTCGTVVTVSRGGLPGWRVDREGTNRSAYCSRCGRYRRCSGCGLADGQDVVGKAREDDGRAGSGVAVQARLAERGFPCARPLTPAVAEASAPPSTPRSHWWNARPRDDQRVHRRCTTRQRCRRHSQVRLRARRRSAREPVPRIRVASCLSVVTVSRSRTVL